MNPERFVKARFEDWKVSGRNIYVDCPFCSDSRKRLGVHLQSGIWGCFNCGKKGALYQLALELIGAHGSYGAWGVPIDIATPVLEGKEGAKEAEEKVSGVLPIEGLVTFTDERLDSGSPPLLRAVGYLMDRTGKSYEWMVVNRLGYSMANGLRVVFPMYRQDVLVYWVARLVVDGEGPKTLHPPGVKRPVFSFEDRTGVEILKIGEGIFDAIALDGVCTLGSNVARDQVEELARMCPGQYWICFDGDEAGRRGAEKLAAGLQMITGRSNIWIVPMEAGEDPASISSIRLDRCLNRRREYDWLESVAGRI